MRHCLAHNSLHQTCLDCMIAEHGSNWGAWRALVADLTVAQQSCIVTSKLHVQALTDLAAMTEANDFNVKERTRLVQDYNDLAGQGVCVKCREQEWVPPVDLLAAKSSQCPECGLPMGTKSGPFCMTCGRTTSA